MLLILLGIYILIASPARVDPGSIAPDVDPQLKLLQAAAITPTKPKNQSSHTPKQREDNHKKGPFWHYVSR